MPESVRDRPTKSHEYVFLLSKSPQYFYDANAIREPSLDTAGVGWLDEEGGKHYRKPWVGSFKSSGRDKKRDLASWAASYGSSTHVGGRNKRSVWTIPTQPFKGAHFAVFPEALVEPMVKAGTSEKGCCVKCGAPWVRVIEASWKHQRQSPSMKAQDLPDNPMYRMGHHNDGLPYEGVRKVLGWRPSCACNAETIPCVVLDPFAGTGTTCLVAAKLNRDWVGIDVSEKYCAMARERLAPYATKLEAFAS